MDTAFEKTWPGRRLVSPAMVGRDEELRGVLSAVADLPALVVIEGEAGIGKTRLVSEVLDQPALRHWRRMVGRCQPIRDPFPLGPVIEAVRGIGAVLDALRLGPVAGALRPLLPELAESLPTAPDALDDRPAERHRVFRGVLELLTALGSADPAVLVLEDMHWADEQTRDLIAYWLSSPTPNLALVLTYRSEEADADLSALTARVPPAIGHAHLALSPLDASRIGALTAGILGVETVSAEFADYMYERSGGSPLAVEELIALVRSRGLLVHHGNAWSRKTLDQLDVPRGIRDPTLQRVTRLSVPAQRVIEAAAVLRTAAPIEVLAATAGELGPVGGAAAVEEALESGLLVEESGSIGFRHVLAAEAVHERLIGPRRLEMHGRAARALRRTAVVPLGRIAHHLGHTADQAAWVDAAEAAADQAVALGHEEEATRILAEVLTRAALTPGQRAGLAIKLGWAAVQTLHASSVVPALSGALDDTVPVSQQAELRFLIASVLNQAGEDPGRQRELLVAALPGLGDRPDLSAWAMVGLSLVTSLDVPIADDARWMARALEVVAEVDDPQLEVFVLGKAASVLVDAGDPSWRELSDRVQAVVAGAPRQRRELNAYYSIGVAAGYAGQLETAGRLLSVARQAPTVAGNSKAELRLRSGLALYRLLQGDWAGLEAEAAELLATLDELALSRLEVTLVAARLALAGGDLDRANSRISEMIERAGELGAYEIIPLAAGIAAQIGLARGDVRGASSYADLLARTTGTKGVWAAACWALPVAVEAWLAAGRDDDARALLDRAAAVLRDLDAPLAPAALAHARGVLGRIPAELVAAAERYDALPAPYEAAAARERAGRILLESGRPAAAEIQLDQALSAYRALGASWDHDRVAQAARSHGIRVSSPSRGRSRPSYGDDLSPREREVADLAATGRTNKEIAARLFVSVKTVDKHIATAMRKLGVRTRTALAHRLRADRADG